VTAVTGAGSVLLARGEATCEPTAFLKVRKSRKFMGTQDDLAVVAAGRALESAGLWPRTDAWHPERVGLFIAVGYIPFREEDIAPVLAASMDGDRFDVRRFGAGGFQQAHPLLTFRCLPNMPAYHVSVCFDVQGPYQVTYPGPSSLYAALEEACHELADRRIDVAVVGGVAHQGNFLVRHHFARIDAPVAPDLLRDAGAFVVIEDEAHARARGAPVRARLEDVHVEYTPLDPLHEGRPGREEVDGAAATEGHPFGYHEARDLGPALLPFAIDAALRTGARTTPAPLRHWLEGRDGVSASSTWVIG